MPEDDDPSPNPCEDVENSVHKIITIQASQKLQDAVANYYHGKDVEAAAELVSVIQENDQLALLLEDPNIGARVFSSAKNHLPRTGAQNNVERTGLDYPIPEGDRFYLAHGYDPLTENPLMKLAAIGPQDKVKIEYAFPKGSGIRESNPLEYMGISIFDMSKIQRLKDTGKIEQLDPTSRNDEFSFKSPDILGEFSNACITTVFIEFPQGAQISS